MEIGWIKPGDPVVKFASRGFVEGLEIKKLLTWRGVPRYW